MMGPDLTYAATWAGFVDVAPVIDAHARRGVGWRAGRTAHAGFVLDDLEPALHDRRRVQTPPTTYRAIIHESTA
jgi:transposase InsO family protein